MTIGILLTNIGTPTAPTPHAVRRYLQEFLSDKRIVPLPSLLWKPLLQCLILPRRKKSSAELYQKIWTEQGSPLLVLSERLKIALQEQLQRPVALGMRYGRPRIKEALRELQAQNVERVLIFPLYPQYSTTTTASVFDVIATLLKNGSYLPEVRAMNDYAREPLYIKAVALTIEQYWQTHEQAHLLFSFHGIPEQLATRDPYASLCRYTAEAISQELKLKPNEWTLAFQSRIGPKKWLTPYTADVLRTLPRQGIKEVHVICPGFAVDCLETLEEIALRGRKQFLQAGGNIFHYIPALNDHLLHVEILKQFITRQIQGW